jgi:hypothetical protein
MKANNTSVRSRANLDPKKVASNKLAGGVIPNDVNDPALDSLMQSDRFVNLRVHKN